MKSRDGKIGMRRRKNNWKRERTSTENEKYEEREGETEITPRENLLCLSEINNKINLAINSAYLGYKCESVDSYTLEFFGKNCVNCARSSSSDSQRKNKNSVQMYLYRLHCASEDDRTEGRP